MSGRNSDSAADTSLTSMLSGDRHLYGHVNALLRDTAPASGALLLDARARRTRATRQTLTQMADDDSFLKLTHTIMNDDVVLCVTVSGDSLFFTVDHGAIHVRVALRAREPERHKTKTKTRARASGLGPGPAEAQERAARPRQSGAVAARARQSYLLGRRRRSHRGAPATTNERRTTNGA